MSLRVSWKRLIVPAAMAEYVKAEVQRIAEVKRTTDGEGGSTEKIRALTRRRRSGCMQRKME